MEYDPCVTAIFATLTEQQATDAELNLAIVAVEDNIAAVDNNVDTVNDSLTVVEERVEGLEGTVAVLDGRIGRLELSGMFNLNLKCARIWYFN